jgi:hypothetical protein
MFRVPDEIRNEFEGTKEKRAGSDNAGGSSQNFAASESIHAPRKKSLARLTQRVFDLAQVLVRSDFLRDSALRGQCPIDTGCLELPLRRITRDTQEMAEWTKKAI